MALSGCISDPYCSGNLTSWGVPGPAVAIERWHSRVEYRIVLTITGEGAASEVGDALRTASVLRFGLNLDRGRVAVFGTGLARADGTEISYTAAGSGVLLENALGDCGEGECSREFRFWAGVAGEGALSASGSLKIPVGSCSDGGPPRFWSEVEHVSNTPEAPPDGGVAP